MSAAVHTAIVDALAALGIFDDVEFHGGRFDEQELARFQTGKPTSLGYVSLLGVSEVEIGAERPVATIQWLVTIVHRSPSKAARRTVPMALAMRVVSHVSLQRWGHLACSRAKNIRARNLYTDTSDAALQASIWGVTWEQQVELTDDLLSSYAELVHMHIETTVGDNDNAKTTFEAGDPL